MPPKPTEDDSVEMVAKTALIEGAELTLEPNQKCILEAARERLLALEANIERRYLKPPLSKGYSLLNTFKFC